MLPHAIHPQHRRCLPPRHFLPPPRRRRQVRQEQPRGAPAHAALLYLHGSGYVMGSCESHRALVARIALAGRVPALLINYRLAPEHPFPAALEDARSAYAWLLAEGIPSARIALVGDSAGGGLAVALAVALRQAGAPSPGGIACLSPWTVLTVSREGVTTCARADPLITRGASVLNAGHYAAGQDTASPLLSPVFADLHGLPPLLIQVGEHEILRSDSERLAENARRAGVEVQLEVWGGMWHLWQAFVGWIPEAQRAIDRVGDFVQRCCSLGGTAEPARQARDFRLPDRSRPARKRLVKP